MDFANSPHDFYNSLSLDHLGGQPLPSDYNFEEYEEWLQPSDAWSVQTYFPNFWDSSWLSKVPPIEDSLSSFSVDVEQLGGQSLDSWDQNPQIQGPPSNRDKDTLKRTVDQCFDGCSFSSGSTSSSSTCDSSTAPECLEKRARYQFDQNIFALRESSSLRRDCRIRRQLSPREKNMLGRSSPREALHTASEDARQALDSRKRRRTASRESSFDNSLSPTASSIDSRIASRSTTTPISSTVGDESALYSQAQTKTDLSQNNKSKYNSPAIHTQTIDRRTLNWNALDRDAEPQTQRDRDHQGSQPQSPEEDDTCDALTPLEMPDGTIRFTANWLPVDCKSDFMIESPMHLGTPRSAMLGVPDEFSQ